MDNIKKNANMFRKIATQISDATGICYDDVCAVLAIVFHIDLQEVRHGSWIKTEHKGYKCSLCNCLSSLFDENLKSEFCPWCGAKMDGDTNT